MLRSWDVAIQIDKQSALPIHKQIESNIIQEIKKGRLTIGNALPGTRALAHDLAVNRKTIIQAYENLAAKGWLITEAKRGTFVAHGHQQATVTRRTDYMPLNHTASDISKPPDISEQVIDFGTDMPDTRLIPYNMVSRALRHALIKASRDHYEAYSDILGSPALRNALFTMLNIERGINADLAQMCVLPNEQMCMHVIAKQIVRHGSHIIVSQMMDPKTVAVFEEAGAKLLFAPHNANGIDLNYIEHLLATNKQEYKIAAIYVSPNSQIPTCACMPAENREKLLQLAITYRFKIIENDDCYYYHYQKPIQAIASAKKFKHTIYVGALSKALSSSLSTSYIISDEKFIQQCAQHHALINQQPNHISEIALVLLLESGKLKKHITQSKRVYETRKNALFNLIQLELSEHVNINDLNTGLAFWVTLKSHVNLKRLMKDLAKLKVNIKSNHDYLEDNVALNSNSQPQGIMLGFGSLNQSEAHEGIMRIKRAFQLQVRTK